MRKEELGIGEEKKMGKEKLLKTAFYCVAFQKLRRYNVK